MRFTATVPSAVRWSCTPTSCYSLWNGFPVSKVCTITCPQEQHISLSINKQDFKITEIELVAENGWWSPSRPYSYYPLSSFADRFTVFETENFYLLHLAIIAAEFNEFSYLQKLHSLRHSNSCARMGVSTISYGATPQTRVSYSNRYFAGERRVTCKHTN